MLIDKKRNIVNKRVTKLGDVWSWNSKNDYENKLFTHQKQRGKTQDHATYYTVSVIYVTSQGK